MSRPRLAAASARLAQTVSTAVSGMPDLGAMLAAAALTALAPPSPALAQTMPHLGRYVLDHGAVRALQLPDGWICARDQATAADPPILCRKAPNPKASTLTITSRPVTPEAIRNAFSTIPNSITLDSLSPDLLADEIRAVSSVLGRRGDNQYLNVFPYPGAKAPGYRLNKVNFRVAAGRIMLVTEGAFMDSAGHPLNLDLCVASPSATDPGRIDEIALTTPLAANADRERGMFDAIVASVDWSTGRR